MASMMAKPIRYCMNTTGAVSAWAKETRRTVLNISEPGGETQTFEPRPRPATWVVAVAVKPLGRLLSRVGFLHNYVH